MRARATPDSSAGAGTGDALVVNSGGTVVGAVTVHCYIDPSANASLGYRHYAALVSGSTVADLATTGFTPTPAITRRPCLC